MSTNHTEPNAMDSAAAQWVRDVAVELGFDRRSVKPLASGEDPWRSCRFEAMGVTYEVRDCRLSIVCQER